ncbi:MAG: NAD-dependent epimerase/dehydratase family protein [Pseudomonadota bacterium]
MRILMLGGTGSVGGAVLDELVSHGHFLIALARSNEAEQNVVARGAQALRGDIRQPNDWVPVLQQVDAVVHTAATFTEDMAEVDRQLMQALVEEGRRLGRPLRFLYTGGVWLYGETGDRAAVETSPLRSISAFRWALDNYALLRRSEVFAANMVHPAMTYTRNSGVIERFIAEARERGRIEIWGTAETRWPLVHRRDLASAYHLVLEHAPPGEAYNVAAQEGVPVADVARAIGRRFTSTVELSFLPRDQAIAIHGTDAEGPTLDQQMCSEKIRKALGWQPQITDALAEVGPR